MVIRIPKSVKGYNGSSNDNKVALACRVPKEIYDKFEALIQKSVLSKSQLLAIMVCACVDKVVIGDEVLVEDAND